MCSLQDNTRDVDVDGTTEDIVVDAIAEESVDRYRIEAGKIVGNAVGRMVKAGSTVVGDIGILVTILAAILPVLIEKCPDLLTDLVKAGKRPSRRRRAVRIVKRAMKGEAKRTAREVYGDQVEAVAEEAVSRGIKLTTMVVGDDTDDDDFEAIEVLSATTGR